MQVDANPQFALDPPTALARARACLDVEREAIATTAAALDDRFHAVLAAIDRTHRARSKLIFTGVGKNAPIAQKVAATFNSTGVAACFLNCTDALHGDLGLCSEGDLAFLFSHRGESNEIVGLVPLLTRLGLETVAVTGAPASALATACDLQLLIRVEREACPLNLAPTASTTATLALGDALAMVYLDARGFGSDDFARLHPGGSLGRFLLLRVRDVMRTGERFARVSGDATVRDAIVEITRALCGVAAVVDDDGGLAGVFSDGDFRRCSLAEPDALSQPVARFMTRSPRTVPVDELAVEAVRRFEKASFSSLVVVDEENAPIGIVDSQDLPRLHLV